jgi:cellobiose phosphorylase
VQHWWHPEYEGVRTRISDDLLFLPYVAAEYIEWTQDKKVLSETVRYLENAEMKPDESDVYREMRPGTQSGTLHDHCMRAFRRAARFGDHGLALMGAGDWNDGMNRVGHLGQGESVWLSQFLAACADSYAEICPASEDAAWLRTLARRHRGAVELYGWDGAWYLRAYLDDGTALGGANGACCRIDLIPQAWAAMCRLSPDRCRAALDAAWDMLVDERHGIIRLLTPPFDGGSVDPGYIRGYPGGVRENGAQYTHAACWLLLALIRMGDADRAHRAFEMLLPARHADTPEKALRYRAEPYVTAADIYDLPGETGRGGWTWYTGSAAWLYVGVLALLGYERRGDRARLNALLGPWPEVSVTLRYSESRYRLVCARGVEKVALDGVRVGGDFITLTDDGRPHEALFPPR